MQYYSTYSVLYRLVGRLGSAVRVSASYSIVIALRLLIFMCPLFMCEQFQYDLENILYVELLDMFTLHFTFSLLHAL